MSLLHNPPPTAWVLLSQAALGQDIGQALQARGWAVTRVYRGLYDVEETLQQGTPPPELLVCGLRFDDGDALRLMRQLSQRPRRPSLYLVTSQPQVVVQAASRLAEACRLRLLGVAPLPVSATMVADRIEAARCEPLPPALPAPQPVLSHPQAQLLLEQGQMLLQLRPTMRLAGRAITGFNALLAARNSDGTLLPAERLRAPLAEARLLDAALLQTSQQALDFLAACDRQRPGLRLGLELPLALLADPAFCHELQQRLAHAGVAPDRITIQTTDLDAASADAAAVLEQTGRIRMLGLRLGITWFGGPRLSAQQLMHLPMSQLTIASAPVEAAEQDRCARALLAAWALFGRALDLPIVAAGVTTPGQLAVASDVGCTHAEGPLLHEPMVANDALRWLARWPDFVWRP
jgi:EAL domain-containing protein (putative c-di-GMP-specific phosphodiesterase class I)